MKITAESRFNEKVVPVPEAGCHLWIGAADPSGYGHFWDGERYVGAHRFAYRMAHGEYPAAGLMVMHSCDTKLCVNPMHLRAGTPAQNTADMFRKGRQNPPVGSRAGKAKMTESQVLEARTAFASGDATVSELAKRYGVDDSAMSRTLSGNAWKSVPLAAAA